MSGNSQDTSVIEQILNTAGAKLEEVGTWLSGLGRNISDLWSSPPVQPRPQPQVLQPVQPQPQVQQPAQPQPQPQPQPEQPQPQPQVQQQPEQPQPQPQVQQQPEQPQPQPPVQDDVAIAAKQDFTTRWPGLDGQCDTALQAAAQLTQPLSQALQTLVTTATEAKSKATAANAANPEDWPAAVLTLDPLDKAAKDLTAGVKGEQDGLAFPGLRAPLDTQCDEVVTRSTLMPALTPALQQLVQAAKDAKAETATAATASPADWTAATLTLDKLKKATTDLDDALKIQESAKTQYDTRREKLTDDEEAVGRVSAPTGPMVGLVQAYKNSAAATKLSLDGGDYAAALTSMTQLETDTQAAVAQKRTGVEASTRLKVDDVMNDLDVIGTDGNPIWTEGHQDPLPTGPLSQEWKDSVTKILDIQLDEDYTARYDKQSEAAAKKIAADPLVIEANTQWATWVADPVANKDKMEAVMNKVIELQSKEIGLDPPTPVSLVPDTDVDLCGQFNPGSKDITLNPNMSTFDDFRELLDTLTHENTHALQTKLVEQYKDGTLQPGHPDYAAAMTLWMNDSKGYVTSDSSDKYDPPGDETAYKDQACEAHAWSAGKKAGQAAHDLLNP